MRGDSCRIGQVCRVGQLSRRQVNGSIDIVKCNLHFGRLHGFHRNISIISRINIELAEGAGQVGGHADRTGSKIIRSHGCLAEEGVQLVLVTMEFRGDETHLSRKLFCIVVLVDKLSAFCSRSRGAVRPEDKTVIMAAHQTGFKSSSQIAYCRRLGLTILNRGLGIIHHIYLHQAAVGQCPVSGFDIASYLNRVGRHHSRNCHHTFITGDGAALELIALAGSKQQCGCPGQKH